MAVLRETKMLRKKSSWLKSHILDTTALLLLTSPLFAFIELYFAGLMPSVSLKNRLYAAILFYLGAGYAFSYLRELYFSLFFYSEASKKSGFGFLLKDMAFGSAFGLAFNFIISYFSSGILLEALKGAIAGAIFGSAAGMLSGIAIDCSRAFLLYSKPLSEGRIVKAIQAFSRKEKQKAELAYLMLSFLFVLLFFAIYYLRSFG